MNTPTQGYGAFGSAYLAHLSALAKEAADRYRGVPPFRVLILMAIIAHSTVLVPIYFLTLAEDVPTTKQVRLAFGVDKKQKKQQQSEQKEQGSKSVLDRLDSLFSPPPPKVTSTPRMVKQQPAPSYTASQRIQPQAQQQPKRERLAPSATSATRANTSTNTRMMRRPDAPTANNPIGNTRAPAAIANSGEVQDIITKYEQLLSGWIHSHHANQQFSLPKGLKGRTVVRIRINRNGFVTRKSIETSSGYAELDNAALNAVERASPVPVVPEEYPGGAQLEFLIPFTITVK